MILIPVKNLLNAKQRLSPLLDQPARTELAQAMLMDVLETLSSWQNHPPVSLVSADRFALKLASRLGFHVISDAGAGTETSAIETATRWCEKQKISWTLVIPGDIPLITVGELEKIFEAAPEQGSLLVPSADRRGTNAAFRRPAGLFPLRFGNESFAPHLASARATGRPCVTLSLPGIALDVDNPSDLRQLALLPGESRSQRILRQWDLSELPLASNA